MIAAAEEERFTRRKHDPGFPYRAIEYCLREGGMTGQDVDYAVFFEKPLLKLERVLASCVQTWPRSWEPFQKSMLAWLADKFWVKKTISDALGLESDDRILFVEHHRSHAASAYFCSPFDEAAILTVDGVGEWATASMGVGREGTLVLLKELEFPHSLGLLYSAFTAFLGFEVNEGEYKVMGLAPYGVPRYMDKISRVVHVQPDGSFWLDMSYFAYHRSAERSYSRKFVELFGAPRDPAEPLQIDHPGCERFVDIAASIQRVTEDILLRMARSLHAETGLRRLCLAGGVALNSVANGRIVREGPFEDIYVQPAAGDAGAALGAALYAYHVALGKPRVWTLEHAYWGPMYGDGELERILCASNVCYVELTTEKLLDSAARLLAEGKIIGWFQGRSEWGPRALGNRSILADPRSVEAKDVLNLKIKYRETFRPFAPSVLAERAEEFFELQNAWRQLPARFMLVTAPVRPPARARIPAVTHVDGSARVHVVRRQENLIYYELLERFDALSGVPVLLNTSLNLKGEPIVNTPQEALSLFFRSGLDALFLGRFAVTRPT